jgi:hypothetical protein
VVLGQQVLCLLGYPADRDRFLKDVREYLHFLFSEIPKKNGFGIFVDKKDGKYYITFKGRFDFDGAIVDEKRVPKAWLEFDELRRIQLQASKRASPATVKKLEKDLRKVEESFRKYFTIMKEREELEQYKEEAEAQESYIENRIKLRILNNIVMLDNK